MRKWDPLNPRQKDVLSRVASGEDVSSDPSTKHSARALHDRGLLAVTRRKGIWSAEVTDAGRFYLDHGYHPERPQPDHDAPATARERPSERSNTGPRQPPHATARIAAERRRVATELIAKLEETGRVDIAKPDEDTLAIWRKVVDFAKRHDMVPSGHAIFKFRMHTGDLRIELVKGVHPNAKPQQALHIDVPGVIDQLHPLLARLSNPAAALGVSENQVPRALRIMHTVLTEADRRGYETGWVDDIEFGAEIRTKELRLYVTLREEHDKRDVLPTTEELAQSKHYAWQRFQPEERWVPSGRLRLEVGTRHSRWDRGQWWADRKRWQLEDKIGEVVAAIDDRMQRERDRLQEEERAHQQRQCDWETAMTRARQLFHEDRRITALTNQLNAWDTARKIRDYCIALEAGPDADEPAQRQWSEWCRAYADRLDPTKNVTLGPEEIEPNPGDLKPYLGRWNPYGP